jgi:peptidoglycan lytic transglycosylase G
MRRSVLATAVLAALASAAWVAWLLAWRAPEHETPLTVTVRDGEPVREIARELKRSGAIPSETLFVVLARWQQLDRRMRSGEYELPCCLTTGEIIGQLAFGRRRLAMVTIPEGLTADEIATLLAAAELGDAARFRALTRDPAFAAQLGLPGDRLEGYLFPDTYDFHTGTPERDILTRMVRRFQEVFTPELVQAAAAGGLSLHQAVTLASLIEKEAAVEAERPMISAVFHNRLARGMALQSDPSAIYGVDGHSGPITHADVARPTSHNTYLLPGLPPGPIANPGRAALLAAVHPAPGVTALYFVARNDRTHEFNETLSAHQHAVNRYLRGRGEAHAGAP